MLGMSASDLSEYIDSAISQNPFLQKINKIADYRNVKTGAGNNDNGSFSITDIARQETDPHSAILSRIRMMGLKDKALEIAEYLISDMDENGYISRDMEELAVDLGTNIEEALKVLGAIQTLEPAGIGARDLGECLQLQLKRDGKEDSPEYEIVSHFLNEAARNDVEKIARALKVNSTRVRAALDNIKRLRPRPCSTMLARDAEKVIPELVAKVDAKKIRLEVNRAHMPELKLYNPYENELDVIKDEEARRFLKENIDLAKKLIDNLRRREETICKVAEHILRFQQKAIVDERHGLRSLTITEVAKALDFHPSTISRVISNKYVQLNDKVIALKNLLSQGVKKANGELASKAVIKNRIAALIEGEDAASPLTDDDIKDLLGAEGINIMRRTIAKYRKALRILPTYLRKKISL